MTTRGYENLVEAVTEDIRCHRENGVDLNPFSTHRARTSWQNGFEGRSLTLLDWHDAWERGQTAQQLLNEEDQE